MKRLLLFLFLASPALAQNRVLELDGQGSYVLLPAHIFDGLEEATVEAWVKWEDWGYYAQWFAFGTDVPTTDDLSVSWRTMGVNNVVNSPLLQFFIYTGHDSLRVLRTNANLPLGQWCHMAAVSGRGGMRFYLNGVLVGQSGYEGSLGALAPSADNYLGKSHWEDNTHFHGQLDEVRVWSVARSAEQIGGAMRQVLAGDEEGLVGLWSFDAGNATDRSPRGHHGHLRGSARCVAAPFPGSGAVVRPTSIEGVVRDEVGAPLNNVFVRLSSANGDEVFARSQRDGSYALAIFGEGTYALDVPSESEQIPPQQVRLKGGESRRLNLPAPSAVARWSAEGDARDGAGSHHGMLMGGATFAPGLVGRAFSLDGVDDYIRVPDAPALNPRGSFSLVAWIFPTDDKWQTIAGKWAHRGQYQLVAKVGLKLEFRLNPGFPTQECEYVTGS